MKLLAKVGGKGNSADGGRGQKRSRTSRLLSCRKVPQLQSAASPLPMKKASGGRPLMKLFQRIRFLRKVLLAWLAGSPLREHDVGAAYATGTDVRQDFGHAARWYRRAAQRGDAESQYEIGFMYLLGEGVKHDPAEGIRWLELAAQHDYERALLLLADIYREGLYGVAADPSRAQRWQAAAEGVRTAEA
jgi:TPR repeat protein